MKKDIKAILAIIIFLTLGSYHSLKAQSFYRMKLGKFEVIALLDGVVPQNLDQLLVGAQPGEISKVMSEHEQTAIMNCNVNAYLVKTSNRLILIDAGTGSAYGPSLGHLTEGLQKAGYRADQINAVLLTHIHMDHIGGLITDDRLTFPNADVYVSKTEADYYLNPANKEKAPQAMKRFFDGAVERLTPVIKAGKLKTFPFGREIFPGIKPVSSIGHSAGHTFYTVQSKKQKMLFWGDIVLSDIVQFADPKVNSVYDYEQSSAAIVRKSALDEAYKSGYWVAVSHIDFPGIGHITKTNSAYHFKGVK